MATGWITDPPIPYADIKSAKLPGLVKHFSDSGDWGWSDGTTVLWTHDTDGNSTYVQYGQGSIGPDNLSGDRVRDVIARKFHVRWISEHDPEFYEDEDEDEDEPIMASTRRHAKEPASPDMSRTCPTCGGKAIDVRAYSACCPNGHFFSVKPATASTSGGPSLEPGNAFRLNARGGWDIMPVPSKVLKEAKFSGYLTIKGIKSSVFETPEGDQWAQKTPPAGLNVSALRRSAARIAANPDTEAMITPELKKKYGIPADARALDEGLFSAVYENDQGHMVKFSDSSHLLKAAKSALAKSQDFLPKVFRTERVRAVDKGPEFWGKPAKGKYLYIVEMEKLRVSSQEERDTLDQIWQEYGTGRDPKTGNKTSEFIDPEKIQSTDPVVLAYKGLLQKMKEAGVKHLDFHPKNLAWGEDGVLKLLDMDDVRFSEAIKTATLLARVASRISGVAPVIRWVAPSLEEEEEELTRMADEEGIDMPNLLAEAHAAKLRPLSDVDWQRLEGTDSYDVGSVNEATHIAEGYGRDVDSVIKGMVGGAGIPAPIILEKPDGSLRLVSGNTRLMAARALGITPDVLWVVAPS